MARLLDTVYGTHRYDHRHTGRHHVPEAVEGQIKAEAKIDDAEKDETIDKIEEIVDNGHDKPARRNRKKK